MRDDLAIAQTQSRRRAAIRFYTEKMRYLIVLLAILPCISPVQAEVLGRLFFTPEERVSLDRERLRTGLPTPQAAQPQAAAPTMESVTLNGHIERSGGKSTLWINGKAQQETPKQITVTKNAAGEIRVKLPESNRVYSLKVGQTLTPDNGEIRESYQRAPPAKPIDGDSKPAAPPSTTPGDPNSAKK